MEAEERERTMPKTLAKIALLGTLGFLLFSGFAWQDPSEGPPYRTGLIPPTEEELAEIVNLWPRVTRVNLNWLGFERSNEVRERKGLQPLDPGVVRPVGREVESSVGGRAAATLGLDATATIAADLPVSVDNSTLKYFPPIRSQNPLGSCAAFSTTYTQLSYMTAFQRDLDIRNGSDNTNKYSPKWTYNMVNGGEDAGSSFNQVYAVLEKHGAATWAEFPYDTNYRAWCLVPSVWRNALSVRSNPVQSVWHVNMDDGLDYVKELLNNGYALVFGTYISSWQYKTIGDDPSTPDDDAQVGKRIGYWLNGTEGSHAMTVVGYNDAIWTDVNGNGTIEDGEKGALRIANSWGTYWEDAGFIWLAYDALRSASAVLGGPSVARVAAFQGNRAYVLTARDNYSPLMIAEFTVNHLKRDQLRLTLGRAATSATSPTTSWTPAAFQNQGGAYAFDGTTTAVDGGFVLDYSDILVEGAGVLRYYLGLSDSTSGDIATLSALKLVDLTTNPATETVCAAVPVTADNQQVYPFVDYLYEGPAYDHPPTLSNPQVNPTIGTPGDTFSYYVQYYDQDGDTPSVKNVVIDGTSHATALASGTASNGWYGYDASLAVGSHTYYFLFEDSRGAQARAPLGTVTLSGPDVYAFLLSALSPSSAGVGGPAFTLTVDGSDFVDGAVVLWDGNDRATTFVSAARVTALISAADIATGRVAQVAVRNPDGGVSSQLEFTIANPFPTLDSLSPDYASGGGGPFTLNLTGTNFISGSIVRWNGVARTTIYVSPTGLQAAITASDIASNVEASVTVFNPEPGGGTSDQILFPVSGFSVASDQPTATVSAGESATYTIRVAAQSAPYDSEVTLSCPTLPRGVTASFSSMRVTPGVVEATTELTLRTTARQSSGAGAAAASAGGGLLGPGLLGLGLLLLIGAAFFARWAARPGVARRSAKPWLAAAAALGLVLVIAGCSASDGGGSSNQGTPAGTYQVGVRGSSGSMMISTQVELVVR
jgi:C1A family cysteine protease